MKCHRLQIREVSRPRPIAVVGPADFVTEPGGEIDPLEVLRDPKYSLYCFDPANDAALFVECSDPVAVDRAAFYYQAQIEHAIGLVSMPLEEFRRVGQEIPEPPNGLIFIHSVGRCGSTLLSKVLQAVPRVHSLSEPDDLTQMVNLRGTGSVSEEWLRDQFPNSIRWRCKPRSGVPAAFVAIKTRSEVLALADLFAASFKQSKHFFLYRNGLSWMRSIFRGFPADRPVYDEEMNRKMAESWSWTVPLVREYSRDRGSMNAVEIRILSWISCMERYFELAEADVPHCAARFEDLTAHPVPILEQFFAFCDIDGVDWDAMREVLDRDSQAGTIYDREERRKLTRELPDDLAEDVRRMIATRPVLRTPDVVVPGTICFPV